MDPDELSQVGCEERSWASVISAETSILNYVSRSSSDYNNDESHSASRRRTWKKPTSTKKVDEDSEQSHDASDKDNNLLLEQLRQVPLGVNVPSSHEAILDVLDGHRSHSPMNEAQKFQIAVLSGATENVPAENGKHCLNMDNALGRCFGKT